MVRHLITFFIVTQVALRQVIAFHANGNVNVIGRTKPSHRHERANTVVAAQRGDKIKAGTTYDGPAFRVVRCFPKLSRREAERAVLDGRVRVDGTAVTPSRRLVGGETLTLDNRKITWEPQARAADRVEKTGAADNEKADSPSRSEFVYHKYHKPVGVTCTVDKHDRRGLFYSLPAELRRKGMRLFPVGRLDLDSNGLVLLTDDGRLADALLQPRYRHEKEYVVTVRPSLSEGHMRELSAGVPISTMQQRSGQTTNSKTEPCVVEQMDDEGTDNNSGAFKYQRLRFILCEGRNRQIRKMVEAVGSEVVSLTRVRHGVLSLGSLPSGTAEEVCGDELDVLLKSAKSNQSGKGSAKSGQRGNGANRKGKGGGRRRS